MWTYSYVPVYGHTIPVTSRTKRSSKVKRILRNDKNFPYIVEREDGSVSFYKTEEDYLSESKAIKKKIRIENPGRWKRFTNELSDNIYMDKLIWALAISCSVLIGVVIGIIIVECL